MAAPMTVAEANRLEGFLRRVLKSKKSDQTRLPSPSSSSSAAPLNPTEAAEFEVLLEKASETELPHSTEKLLSKCFRVYAEKNNEESLPDEKEKGKGKPAASGANSSSSSSSSSATCNRKDRPMAAASSPYHSNEVLATSSTSSGRKGKEEAAGSGGQVRAWQVEDSTAREKKRRAEDLSGDGDGEARKDRRKGTEKERDRVSRESSRVNEKDSGKMEKNRTQERSKGRSRERERENGRERERGRERDREGHWSERERDRGWERERGDTDKPRERDRDRSRERDRHRERGGDLPRGHRERDRDREREVRHLPPHRDARPQRDDHHDRDREREDRLRRDVPMSSGRERERDKRNAPSPAPKGSSGGGVKEYISKVWLHLLLWGRPDTLSDISRASAELRPADCPQLKPAATLMEHEDLFVWQDADESSNTPMGRVDIRLKAPTEEDLERRIGESHHEAITREVRKKHSSVLGVVFDRYTASEWERLYDDLRAAAKSGTCGWEEMGAKLRQMPSRLISPSKTPHRKWKDARKDKDNAEPKDLLNASSLPFSILAFQAHQSTHSVSSFPVAAAALCASVGAAPNSVPSPPTSSKRPQFQWTDGPPKGPSSQGRSRAPPQQKEHTSVAEAAAAAASAAWKTFFAPPGTEGASARPAEGEPEGAGGRTMTLAPEHHISVKEWVCKVWILLYLNGSSESTHWLQQLLHDFEPANSKLGLAVSILKHKHIFNWSSIPGSKQQLDMVDLRVRIARSEAEKDAAAKTANLSSARARQEARRARIALLRTYFEKYESEDWGHLYEEIDDAGCLGEEGWKRFEERMRANTTRLTDPQQFRPADQPSPTSAMRREEQRAIRHQEWIDENAKQGQQPPPPPPPPEQQQQQQQNVWWNLPPPDQMTPEQRAMLQQQQQWQQMQWQQEWGMCQQQNQLWEMWQQQNQQWAMYPQQQQWEMWQAQQLQQQQWEMQQMQWQQQQLQQYQLQQQQQLLGQQQLHSELNGLGGGEETDMQFSGEQMMKAVEEENKRREEEERNGQAENGQTEGGEGGKGSGGGGGGH
uniref:Uncharacterized protein n=1 Tax=Chromera velia CCMP2878 TaxID=1169474 RepID=A0A0G4HD89_9ALVE|eukprot:Cvel_6344.t1-p1 / transcript=Cvel_6344.t1 / gene=Cvel_6344 / organism=Chromera_velia_CCMP2878 / gene_product=hypothetical protein / transcript_product=hypothetical protein / location=Cvel_scaffold308:24348-29526(-) / protein_length=1047 / sequence_SO=supercontig / SO=protein_coding / is_pseudo=false